MNKQTLFLLQDKENRWFCGMKDFKLPIFKENHYVNQAMIFSTKEIAEQVANQYDLKVITLVAQN
jgi:hypothetical protein